MILPNSIINDDCIRIMSEMPDKFVDMVLTDIPYNEVNRKSNGLRNLDKGDADTLSFDIDEFINLCIKKCRGSIYIWCGTEQVSLLRKTMVDNKMSTRLVIWEKSNPSPMNGDNIWLSGVECCVYGKFPNATFNGHCLNTVLRFPCGRNKIHPTQKPLKLFEKLIEISSNPNDIVLDTCAGSGTTGVACKNLGRRFILIEKNKDYYDACVNRVNGELA